MYYRTLLIKVRTFWTFQIQKCVPAGRQTRGAYIIPGFSSDKLGASGQRRGAYIILEFSPDKAAGEAGPQHVTDSEARWKTATWTLDVHPFNIEMFQ